MKRNQPRRTCVDWDHLFDPACRQDNDYSPVMKLLFKPKPCREVSPSHESCPRYPRLRPDSELEKVLPWWNAGEAELDFLQDQPWPKFFLLPVPYLAHQTLNLPGLISNESENHIQTAPDTLKCRLHGKTLKNK